MQRRIVITGCASGFGLLMAQIFAAEGWLVLATTRTPEKFPVSADNIHVLGADVASPAGRATIEAHIKDHWGGHLDCLVNNAGFGLVGVFENMDEDQMRRQMELNFFAPLLLTRALLPALRATKGKVINISSVLGYMGMPLNSLYCASKFAIEGWSESLRYELQQHGVQVALVEPGGFRTGFAKHIEWTVASAANAPLYDSQLQGFKNSFTKILQKGKGRNPAVVAQTVLKLAIRRNMPLRIRIGPDAHAAYYLRRILPQILTDKLFSALGNRMMDRK
jgi:NAD(P)-dependent dehydrogenase (short-subunit alcohol dehydrogenase family)